MNTSTTIYTIFVNPSFTTEQINNLRACIRESDRNIRARIYRRADAQPFYLAERHAYMKSVIRWRIMEALNEWIGTGL